MKAQCIDANPWKQYWSARSDPYHRSDTREYYRQHAAEIQALIDLPRPDSVLEIGCGNGVLFELLGLDKTVYRGVDISPAMLNAFAATHPKADIVEADGSSYRDDRRYDLILSSQVIQYMMAGMLRRHIANARAMMHADSKILIIDTPWRTRRRDYYSRSLVPPYRRNLGVLLRSYAGTMLRRKDPFGYWYNIQDLQAMAGANGLRASFFGSLHYLYRFHTVMTIAEVGA